MIAVGSLVHPKYRVFRWLRKLIAVPCLVIYPTKKLAQVLGDCCYHEGNFDQAVRYYLRMMEDRFDSAAYDSIYRANYERRWDIPPILINSLMRSGSTFLENALARGLGLPMYDYSNGEVWPNRAVDPSALVACVEDHGLSRQHVFPYQDNLPLLERHYPKIILHVRDPRQALLSYVHYCEEPDIKGELLEKAVLGEDYYAMPLSKKIDWQIEHYFDSLIRWIEEWVDVADNGKASSQFLFTTFEALKDCPQKTFDRILDFYGIDRVRFIPPPSSDQLEVPKRKAQKDEWRSQFTEEQCKRVDEKLSDFFLAEFGWTR